VCVCVCYLLKCSTVLYILDAIHTGLFYHIWSPDKPTVDRRRCTCDCFDTVFRGRVVTQITI